jgi:hypothetical protein
VNAWIGAALDIGSHPQLDPEVGRIMSLMAGVLGDVFAFDRTIAVTACAGRRDRRPTPEPIADDRDPTRGGTRGDVGRAHAMMPGSGRLLL